MAEGIRHKMGRPHPASKSVPGGGGQTGKFGRDVRKPLGIDQTEVPTGPGGRNHPASKGTNVPKMTDPNG